jgi:hypothetical protein
MGMVSLPIRMERYFKANGITEKEKVKEWSFTRIKSTILIGKMDKLLLKRKK